MPVKIGLGLLQELLTRENFRFAKQAGCTHIVAHLVERFTGRDLPGTDESCLGMTRSRGRLWSEQELRDLKKAINDEGLIWEAIENFDPSVWHDVLLDGPRKQQQMENLKTIIRRIGKVGIPIMGYYFSVAGVWGREKRPFARGGAISPGYLGPEGSIQETPIPNGQVWNMVYDPDAPPGNIGTITEEEIWHRAEEFLQELVPVAEDAGVRLAAHPDDPPMPTLRGTARLIYQPRLYQRLLDLVPSRANALEFCLGTTQEMTEGNLYETIEQYLNQGAVAYIHFRNVRGKVPDYREMFIDEGDIDMIRVMRILHRSGFDGVLIPDHTPQMSCNAPWHAGMAHAVGYMRAALQAVESESYQASSTGQETH